MASNKMRNESTNSGLQGYKLLDSGNGRKLEQFGPYIIERPASQAVWNPLLSQLEWKSRMHASFSREGKSGWNYTQGTLPENWEIDLGVHKMLIQPTDFGHLGIFPEQLRQWKMIRSTIESATKRSPSPVKVLNLFAYSGGSTLASALGGAHVCHLDASKGMVDWARKNSELNGLQKHPIRWIVEDVLKFCSREEKRGSLYDAIILDPPSFGRGSKGEVFKIEDEIHGLLTQVVRILKPDPLFVLFSCHTPGFTPTTMSYLMEDALKSRPEIQQKTGVLEKGEMLLENILPYDSEITQDSIRAVPSGTYALWKTHLAL